MFDGGASLLEYPAGLRPGFNPAHVAGRGKVYLSGVPLGTGFVNTLSGVRTTNASGTPLSRIHGQIGPVLDVGGTGTSDMPEFVVTGMPAPPAQTTFAAILDPSQTANSRFILMVRAVGSNGFGISYRSGFFSWEAAWAAGGTKSSGITLTAGVPYFVAMSENTSGVHFLVRRLDTGRILTATAAAVAPIATPPTWFRVGNYEGADPGGKIAAVMWSDAFLSPQDLMMWAQDPWAFWYPR